MILALLVRASSPAAAEQFTAKVVGVTDGDTITIRRGWWSTERVRLNGIDTPEHGQPFGPRAQQFTPQLVFRRIVTIGVGDCDLSEPTAAHAVLPDGKHPGQSLPRPGRGDDRPASPG